MNRVGWKTVIFTNAFGLDPYLNATITTSQKHEYLLKKIAVCQATFVAWVLLMSETQNRSFANLHSLRDFSDNLRSGTKFIFSSKNSNLWHFVLCIFHRFFSLGFFVGWVGLPRVCVLSQKQARAFVNSHLPRDCSSAPWSGTKPIFSQENWNFWLFLYRIFHRFLLFGLERKRFSGLDFGTIIWKNWCQPCWAKTVVFSNAFGLDPYLIATITRRKTRIFPRKGSRVSANIRGLGILFCLKTGPFVRNLLFAGGLLESSANRHKTQFFLLENWHFFYLFIAFLPVFFSWAGFGSVLISWVGLRRVCVLPETQARSFANFHLLRDFSWAPRVATKPIFFHQKTQIFDFLYFAFLTVFFLVLGWVRLGWLSLCMCIAWDTDPFFRKLTFAAGVFGRFTKRHKPKIFCSEIRIFAS